MSQNPYSQFGGSGAGAMGPGGAFDVRGGRDGGLPGGVEPRTSIAAVISLVSGLLCCIPGLGLLGIITGIASLFFIGGSHGRITGRGLAISGLLLGCLSTAIQVGVLLGASWYSNRMLADMSAVAVAVEQQDFAKARTAMGSATATSITDEQFAAFRQAYQAELGAFQSLPSSPIDWFTSYGRLGNAFQGYKGANEVIPMPAVFDNGSAIMFFRIEPNTPPPPGRVVPPFDNLGIRTSTGNEYWLTGPNAVVPAGSPP
jgi:hypothetical protein